MKVEVSQTDKAPYDSFKVMMNITCIVMCFTIVFALCSVFGLSINAALMQNSDNCTIIEKNIIQYPTQTEIDLLIRYGKNDNPLWFRKNFTSISDDRFLVGESYRCFVSAGKISWNRDKIYHDRIILFSTFLALSLCLCFTCLGFYSICLILYYRRRHNKVEKEYYDLEEMHWCGLLPSDKAWQSLDKALTKPNKVRQTPNKVRQSVDKVKQTPNKVRQSVDKVKQTPHKVRKINIY